MSEIFLSYSRNDNTAASALRAALERAGLQVFKDDASLRSGDRWLGRLQTAVGSCDAFVVQVGRDGVQRWIGAEVEVALIRHHQPDDDAKRLPIFPILLPDAGPESLPPFLALFQATRWDGVSELPISLIDALRARQANFNEEPIFERCPFLGLSVFTREDTRLFFGRSRETLAAIACLGDQSETNPEPLGIRASSAYKRWLQIEGNSGSGKSSLVQAGMLPLIERGALWARTGFEHWQILGPMMPGQKPVEKLAEVLERGLVADPHQRDIGARRQRLEPGGAQLTYALRASSVYESGSAFLLVIDQFEELFTFTDEPERKTFDALLTHALNDPECPLFVVSTIRADFLDCLDRLTCLSGIYNSLCARYFLPRISEKGLHELIVGPARLAGLDVSEVLTAILEEAREELEGALPLVENALMRLWEMRTGNRLRGDVYREEGGLAGMLARYADALLSSLEFEQDMSGKGRQGALALLLKLTRISDDGRHSRQRIRYQDAVAAAGLGDVALGERIVQRLSGERIANRPTPARVGAMRLVVVTMGPDRQVDLIHETLIRARSGDPKSGRMLGYWPTLYDHIEANRVLAQVRWEVEQAARAWEQARTDSRLAASLLWGWERQKAAIEAFLVPGLAPAQADAEYTDQNIHAWSALQGSLEEPVRSFLRPEPLSLVDDLARDDTTHVRREDIGRRLNAMPDPRRGVGLEASGVPDIAWEVVEIPREGAVVTLETEPPQQFTISKPFQIARYPVTWQQYRAFLESEDGYRNPEWWAGLRSWREPGWPRWDFGNHPVICVSWHDAVAFCRWLTARLRLVGEAVRLPTEWEWQWVAQAGGANLRFPWGTDWLAVGANSGESGIGRTTAVGLFPAGEVKGGEVFDLAGNIWEWCQNEFERPSRTGVDSDALRVARGGSWGDGPGGCRSASRYYSKPGIRDSRIGFRVCLDLPISPRYVALLSNDTLGR